MRRINLGMTQRGMIVVLGATILSAIVGCGGDMVPAKGRVQYDDGSPIKGAVKVIRFEPDDDTEAVVRKTGYSDIADDGSFDLMTMKPGDGVYKGNYVVVFTVLESPESGKSLIKKQYASFVESPFEVQATEGKSDYLFELEKLPE